jgi:thiol:disulfide interchange protein DsbA
MMKNLFWIGAVVLLLTACGSDEPAQTAAVEQPAAAQPVDDSQPAAEPVADDEALQVVEESAAEPEPEEQAILLAQADVPATTREWKYQQGQHYARLMPAQPTVGGADKIEVAEFFWYGCPHCYDFEPYINGWNENKPGNVRFVRMPAMWNGILVLHAKLFFTQEILARNGVIKDAAAFHEAVFQEYHRRGNRLANEAAIQKLFERYNVSADEFESTWNSFEVSQKMRVAEDLARRYSVANVPTVVVNGKYRTGGGEAGSYPNLLEVIDELIARESAR